MATLDAMCSQPTSQQNQIIGTTMKTVRDYVSKKPRLIDSKMAFIFSLNGVSIILGLFFKIKFAIFHSLLLLFFFAFNYFNYKKRLCLYNQYQNFLKFEQITDQPILKVDGNIMYFRFLIPSKKVLKDAVELGNAFK